MRPSDLKSLKVLLGAIRGELTALKEVVQETYASVVHQRIEERRADQEEGEKTREVIAALRPTPGEQAAAETNQERRHGDNLRIQRWLTAGTWLAFSAAAVYAWIAHEQFKELQKSSWIAHEQLTQTQNQLDTTMAQFDRNMDLLITQTTQQVKTAGAAQDANERATKFFREQQSPELSLSVVPHDFGKQDASVEVSLKNSGHSAASDVSLRWFINGIGEDNIKTPRTPVHSYQNGRLAPGTPGADAWNALGDESDEEGRLMRFFDDMIDPAIPFDLQSPVLPSEETYARMKELGLRQRQTFKRMGAPEGKPGWLEKTGTLYTAAGELGPNQDTTFTAQGEIAHGEPSYYSANIVPTDAAYMRLVENGKRVLYFSCRFTYTDKFHPNVTERSPDFCFKYVPSTGSFENCVKPQN